MRLFIDGDGSPVKDDVIKLGESYGLDVIIVTSVDHYTIKEYANHVQIVYVDRGADSADYKIVGMVKKNDFLITQDYGLASLVLPKGVRVFHHSGKEFDGPKPFTEKDHTAFRQALKKAIDQGLPSTEDSR